MHEVVSVELLDSVLLAARHLGPPQPGLDKPHTALDSSAGLSSVSLRNHTARCIRVTNIIETMTYMCYRYINRGLYEKDKLTFVLLVTMKILITAELLKTTDLTIFLRGGAALDINSVRSLDILIIFI